MTGNQSFWTGLVSLQSNVRRRVERANRLRAHRQGSRCDGVAEPKSDRGEEPHGSEAQNIRPERGIFHARNQASGVPARPAYVAPSMPIRKDHGPPRKDRRKRPTAGYDVVMS